MNGISEHLKTKAMKQLSKRMQNGKKDLLKIVRENSVQELLSSFDNYETVDDYLMTYYRHLQYMELPSCIGNERYIFHNPKVGENCI